MSSLFDKGNTNTGNKPIQTRNNPPPFPQNAPFDHPFTASAAVGYSGSSFSPLPPPLLLVATFPHVFGACLACTLEIPPFSLSFLYAALEDASSDEGDPIISGGVIVRTEPGEDERGGAGEAEVVPQPVVPVGTRATFGSRPACSRRREGRFMGRGAETLEAKRRVRELAPRLAVL